MKILLPVDGSRYAKKTVAWAASIFNARQTSYYLVSVMGILPELPESFAANAVAYETLLADGKNILNEAGQYLISHNAQVAESNCLFGDPARQICNEAIEKEIDLIVMGTHGRTGMGKFLLGSVSEGVLKQSQKPVLLYYDPSEKPTSEIL